MGCHDCTKGQSVKPGTAGPCKGCSAGRFYQNIWDGRAWLGVGCTPCAKGQFQILQAQEKCAKCLPGLHANATGSATCTVCPVGQFAHPAATSCRACQPGQYGVAQRPHFGQNRYAENYCVMCPEGYFMGTEAALHCSACAAGRYGSSEGMKATSCSGRCALGRRVAPAQTSSKCNGPCNGGRYGGSCNGVCTPGRFSLPGSSTSCTGCPAGRFMSAAAADECELCAPGHYARGTHIVCHACVSICV
jgi:hypothetical protein